MRAAWLIPMFSSLSLLFFCSCRAEYINPLFSAPTAVPSEYSVDGFPSNVKLVGKILVGSGVTSFLPDEPLPIVGFSGRKRRLIPPWPFGAGGLFSYLAVYNSVDLPPRAKTIIWKDSTHLIALVALDLVAVTPDMTQKLVKTLARAFPTLDLSLSNVQFLASHTHSGPGGLAENPLVEAFAFDTFNPKFFEKFEASVLSSFANALQDAEPVAEVRERFGALPGFNRSRLSGMAVDERILNLTFLKEENPLSSASFLAFAVHPIFFPQTGRVLTSDITGHIEMEMERQGMSHHGIFLTGNVGNAEGAGPTEATQWSRDFVDAISNSSKFPVSTAKTNFAVANRIVELPSPQVNVAGCGLKGLDQLLSLPLLNQLPRRTKYSAFRFGSHLALLFPGEPTFDLFSEIKDRVQRALPDIGEIWMLSTANDYISYAVTPAYYRSRSVEACSALYGEDLAARFSDASLELAGTLFR